MSLKIPVAHDFVCPWCWVGLLQAKRLIEEEGVEIEWLAYELWPKELPKPPPTVPPPPNPLRPEVPSRLSLILYADGVELPVGVRPTGILTHNAHEAVEFAKQEGRGFEMAEALYRAYWQRGIDIGDPDAVVAVASALDFDRARLRQALDAEAFRDAIVGFDEPAYASGIYNVPTFTIDGRPFAEQPYVVLQRAIRAAKAG